MKNKLFLLFASLFVFSFAGAQQTAMQFSGLDCNNNAVDLYADLNAGKAVVLFYYMPNCGTCPPVAQKIQTMANNIMNTYPGMVKGYAYPYQNSTTCAYSVSWVTGNNLAMYAPMDSGAAQVAYYGGFGMPTVVLVGGTDHRVMFSTLSFSTSDTTIMRDSILNLLNPASISMMESPVSAVRLFPNPANEKLQIEADLAQSTAVKVEVLNLLGEIVSVPFTGNAPSGLLRREIPTDAYSNGVYFIRITAGEHVTTQRFTVSH